MVLSGMVDRRLTYRVRGLFTYLMNILYVDRAPQVYSLVELGVVACGWCDGVWLWRGWCDDVMVCGWCDGVSLV